MTTVKQPNEVPQKSGNLRSKEPVKHNAVTDNDVPVLIRKKRQFGGLICPPIGMVTDVAGSSSKRNLG